MPLYPPPSNGITWRHPAGNPVELDADETVTITHANKAISETLLVVAKQVDVAPAVFSPVMTGANAPSPYVVSDSGHYSGNDAWMIFNGGSVTTPWSTYGTSNPYWFKLDLGSGNAKVLGSYTLRCRNNGGLQYWENWHVEGSNDDTNWTTLDTQTGVTTGWTFDVDRTFTIASPGSTAYRYFRVTNDTGGPVTDAGLTRCTMLDIGGDPFFAPVVVGPIDGSDDIGASFDDEENITVKNQTVGTLTLDIGIGT